MFSGFNVRYLMLNIDVDSRLVFESILILLLQLRLIDLFRSFDKDGSGSVTKQELKKGLKVMLR